MGGRLRDPVLPSFVLLGFLCVLRVPLRSCVNAPSTAGQALGSSMQNAEKQKGPQCAIPISYPVPALLALFAFPLRQRASMAAGQAAAVCFSPASAFSGLHFVQVLAPTSHWLRKRESALKSGDPPYAATFLMPESAFKASTLSRFSQVNSGSSRPKCP